MKKRVDRGGSDYEENFQIIWNMTMERIRTSEYALEERCLLQILAYANPDGFLGPQVEGVFKTALAVEHNTLDDGLFDEAMSLLKRLVLVRTWNVDSEDRWYTQMHRIVQSFARQDDSEGNGQCYILERGTMSLAVYYFSSQPKLAIPPAVLQSDQLIAAWLIYWFGVTFCNITADKSELVFDDTHVEQLSRRKSDCFDGLLALVHIGKMISSGQWKRDEQTFWSAITNFLRKSSPIIGYFVGALFKLGREVDHPAVQCLLQILKYIYPAPLLLYDEMRASKCY